MERAPQQSSSPRPVRPCVLAWAAGAVLGLAATFAQAANPLAAAVAGGGSAATTDATPKVETVPAADIPLRADADERFVQEVASRARQRDPSARLGPRLEALKDGIASLSASYTAEQLERLSVVRLESIERHWRFYDRELASWRRDLDRVTAPYSANAATLAEKHAVWGATREALAEGGVASALSNRVAGILRQIQDAEQALSGPLEAQIRLGRRANAVQASIDSGKNVIGGAIETYDRRLATIDSPPVWDAWQDTELTQNDLRGSGTGLRIENVFLDEWTAANKGRLLGFHLSALALLPLLLWLAWRNRTVVPTEPATVAAARVLRRPVSAWLVLVLVGTPFLLPDAPVILTQIAMLLALIPVLRLLPPKVYAVLGAWPYVATALYVAYRLSFLLLDDPLRYRLYLLGVTVVNVAALVWLLFSSGRDAQGVLSKRLRGVLRLAGWLAVTALVASIAANVVGNVTLAEMLTGAVLDSAYAGFALFAGAHVLSSVLHLLMARRSLARFRLITQHTGPLLAWAERLVLFAALVVWVIVIGNEFRIARPVASWVKAVLTHPFEAGQISVTLGSILLFGFAIWIAFWVARTVRVLLRDEVLPKMALPRGVDNSVSTLSYYALIIVGLMVALAAAGFEMSQFALIFGALGVGIGFGLQNIVNNFVSGLILMFERPIQPGDVVEVSGTSGKVRDIGMRATTLTTFEGADVIVPNGTLLSEKLVNWTLSDMNRRVDVDVGVAYGTDPRRVLALLDEIARTTPGVADEPAPSVVFLRFAPNSLDFGIRAWTNDFGNWVAVRTEMTARLYEALQREGIDIPLPQQDLHLRSVSAEAAARLAGGAASARAEVPKPQPARQC